MPASKFFGCWLNASQRMRVSGRKIMSEAVFATGVPFGAKATLPHMMQDLSRLMPVCAGLRRWGSAALDLAYVAAGRYEGYWERELQAWDIAAGILLVREAGGVVGGFGDGDPLMTGGVIASNDALAVPFRKALTV